MGDNPGDVAWHGGRAGEELWVGGSTCCRPGSVGGLWLEAPVLVVWRWWTLRGGVGKEGAGESEKQGWQQDKPSQTRSVKHPPHTEHLLGTAVHTDREIHRACLKPHGLNGKNNTERNWGSSGKISCRILLSIAAQPKEDS